MSDDGNYQAWKQAVGLSLGIDDDDMTSLDYPLMPEADYDDDAPMAGELLGLPSPDDDRDPTLRLECSVCGAAFSACECLGGPKKLWTPGLLPFEALNPKDADQ